MEGLTVRAGEYFSLLLNEGDPFVRDVELEIALEVIGEDQDIIAVGSTAPSLICINRPASRPVSVLTFATDSWNWPRYLMSFSPALRD